MAPSLILDPIDILGELVAIPSVSPMCHGMSEDSIGEARLTTFLEQTLSRIGLTVWRQPVMPGRDNLLARLDGDVPAAKGGHVVLFDAHQDTVPVDGMTVDPFRLQQRNGRIYGRGACDVKGGMAAMLAAVSRVAHERPRHMPTIIVSCTVDEENGFRGAARLAKSWALDNDLEIPRPDAIIVLEPTGLDVVVAHKGVIRWKAHALGLASHSSSPQLGVNAIYKMARAVTAIEQYAGILAGGATHSSCGVATVSVGVIHGGTSTNIVPDQCTIEIDLRPLPGEDLTDARQRLLDHITHHSAIGLENETPYMQGPSLATEHNGPLARQLAALVQGMNGGCRLAGMSCCTNASLYADMGVPTVVFGPGFLEQAHTRDEWISVDQLIQATEIIDRFCSTFVV